MFVKVKMTIYILPGPLQLLQAWFEYTESYLQSFRRTGDDREGRNRQRGNREGDQNQSPQSQNTQRKL